MPPLPVEPQVGQVLTVFRSRLSADPDAVAAYAEHAARMSALAVTMPGYVEHKAFTAPDGERVTLVTFADRAGHDAWAQHPDHQAAQREGRARYYDGYTISVGTVEHARSFSR